MIIGLVREGLMRPTLVLMMALAAAAAAAQTTRRQACELLSVADVEAAIGVSPLRSFDQQKTGKHCRFEKAGNQLFFFEIFVEYVDPPDATPSPSG